MIVNEDNLRIVKCVMVVEDVNNIKLEKYE